MKFLHLFKSSSAYDGFARIQGYEDIKDVVRRALESDEYQDTQVFRKSFIWAGLILLL
jgi:hypothetical protein